MTNSIWNDAGMIATAFGIVALVSIPAGLITARLARRMGADPILQPWRLFSTRWNGSHVLLLFMACLFGRQLGVLGSLIMMPLFIWGFQRLKTLLQAESTRPLQLSRQLANVSVGVWTCLAFLPVVFLVHFASLLTVIGMGGKPDEHPLSEAPHWVLFLAGCVVGPFYEELMFRRIMIPWAMGRHYRPWLIHMGAIVGTYVAVMSNEGKQEVDLFAPLSFVLLLSVSLMAVQALPRVRADFPVRTVGAIWSTATLFAVMHSGVWPTPIPLFVFGLVLGWLMARQQSLLTTVIAHGLFNAVSVIHVLRGGT